MIGMAGYINTWRIDKKGMICKDHRIQKKFSLFQKKVLTTTPDVCYNELENEAREDHFNGYRPHD